MLVLNDVHLGVRRKGGTTPATQEALRSYLFSAFEQMLYDTQEKHLLILGDLFDEFEVSPRDWLQTYLILQDWCTRGKTLTLVAGNHDWSPKGVKLSSFQMLAEVLVNQFGLDTVQIVKIDEWSRLFPGFDGCIALAHCSNQDIFDMKLAEVLASVKEGDSVFVHCNFDNKFAAVSDHSLNISREKAYEFKDKGVTLYFAHEHQAKVDLGGRVVIFGNQWPTSIADCLGNDFKFTHTFNEGGYAKVVTWSRADGPMPYSEVEWQELLQHTDIPGFVKVVGEATASQSAEVIGTIAKFRQRASTLVISNAVKVDGIVEAEALPESFEVAKAFDVMAFIQANTTEREYETILKLREPA